MKGKAEGLQEGERKKSIEMAKKMLEQHISVASISEISGLSDDTLLRLKEKQD